MSETKKELDLSGFDEAILEADEQDSSAPSKMTAKEMAEFGAPSEAMETAEDFATGTVQGATLGTSPLIAGGVKGLTRALTADDYSELDAPGTAPTELDRLQILQDEYYKGRDTQLQKEDAAFDRSPIANLAGNILGGAPIGGSVLAGKGLKEAVKSGVKAGTKFGAVAGFGSGEGKLLGEDASIEQVLEESATGGAMGGLLGGTLPIATSAVTEGIPSVVKGTKNFVKDTQMYQDLLDTYRASAKGKSVLAKDSASKMSSEAKEFIEGKIIPSVKEAKQTSGKEIDRILKESDTIMGPQDISSKIDELQSLISQQDPATKKGRKTIKELERFLGKYQKEKTVTRGQYSRNEDPGEMIIDSYIDETVPYTEANLTPSQLAEQTRGLSEIVSEAKKKKDVAGDVYSEFKNLRDESIAPELKEDYLSANKTYSNVIEAEKALGKKALGPLDSPETMKTVNTLITRLKKADESGVPSESVRLELDTLVTQIRKINPNLADEINSVTKDLSRRHELTRLGDRRSGFSLKESPMRLAMRGADYAPKIVEGTKKAISSTAQSIEDLVGPTASSLAKKGATKSAEILSTAAKKLVDPEVGIQAKAATRFAISQQPAFRAEMKKQEESPSNESEVAKYDLSGFDEVENESIAPMDPLEAYNTRLAESESSGKYDAVSPSKTYIGKYQHGPIALKDIGYKGSQNNWLPSSGISSDAEYLANPELQEKVQREWVAKTDSYIKNTELDKFIGKKIKYIDPNTGEVGIVKVSENGLRAAIHLNGIRAIQNMFKTGKVPVDGNKTPATTYLKKHEE